MLLAALAVSSLAGGMTAGAQDGVIKGGANAWADSMAFEILSGGASIGWTFGRSTASYRDVTASADGRAVDLGALKTLLGLPQCDGKFPPVLNMATLPPSTTVDSGTPGAQQSLSANVNLPGFGDKPAGKPIGSQSAKATPQPWAQSSTRSVTTDFGFFRVVNATTTSTTEFSDGVRTAHAVSSAEKVILMGGLVVFNNPRWEAVARSGADTSTQATFTFDSVKVFNNYLKGSDAMRNVTIFKAIVETVLKPLGIVVQIPQAVPPAAGSGISISPLGMRIVDPPIGKGLVIPLLNSELIAELKQRALSKDCRNETVFTVLDAVEAAMGGSGSINMYVGGATATTDDQDYSFKPMPAANLAQQSLTPVAPPATDSFDAPDVGAPTGDFSADVPTDDFSTDVPTDDFSTDVPTGDFGTGTGTDPAGTEVAAATINADPKVAKASDSKEIAAGTPAASASTSNAAAVAVGVLALMGAVALSMGDRLLGRRRRRTIP